MLKSGTDLAAPIEGEVARLSNIITRLKTGPPATEYRSIWQFELQPAAKKLGHLTLHLDCPQPPLSGFPPRISGTIDLHRWNDQLEWVDAWITHVRVRHSAAQWLGEVDSKRIVEAPGAETAVERIDHFLRLVKQLEVWDSDEVPRSLDREASRLQHRHGQTWMRGTLNAVRVCLDRHTEIADTLASQIQELGEAFAREADIRSFRTTVFRNYLLRPRSRQIPVGAINRLAQLRWKLQNVGTTGSRPGAAPAQFAINP